MNLKNFLLKIGFVLGCHFLLPKLGQLVALTGLQIYRGGLNHKLIFEYLLQILELFHLQLNFDRDAAARRDDALNRLDHKQLGCCRFDLIRDVVTLSSVEDV